MTEREGKIAEVENFSKRQAQRYYTVARKLAEISVYMTDNNMDYGELFKTIDDAVIKANDTAGGYWADYKSAARIVDGNPPLSARKARVL